MTHDSAHSHRHADPRQADQSEHSDHGEQWHDLPEGFAEHLEVESRLSEPIRQSVIAQVVRAVHSPPSLILDIGSGTGGGSVALAKAFPTARVHAMDVSSELLEHVHSAAMREGVADRVTGHSVDLSDEWPQTGEERADLVWASLSIHHLADPEITLRRALQALKPGGLFVMIELTGEPACWPTDLETGHEGLANRIARELPSPHAREASQWSGLLEQAGFTGIEYRDSEFVASASTPDGARYIEQRLQSSRDRLAGILTDADLSGIDQALASVHSGTSTVSFTAPRGVWMARRHGA